MNQGAVERPGILLLAEASQDIGTGHAVEAFALADAARQLGVPVELWLDAAAPAALLGMAPCPVRWAEDLSPETLALIAVEAKTRGCRVAVTNFRRVTNDAVRALLGVGLEVVCIDEWGHLKLDCAAVINPSIVTDYHQYESDHPDFRLHAGPQYLALSAEYQHLHGAPRVSTGPVKSVVVAMGGTDRTGGTLPVVEGLLGWRQDVEVHIVAGPAFVHLSRLEELLKCAPGSGLHLHRNLPTLAHLLATCDVGFNMGGNTLYEMACVGTPAIALYEEEHERRQGLAFEELGAACCLGPAADVKPGRVNAALDLLSDPQKRTAMSSRGRAIVDGGGAQRVIALALGLADVQASATAGSGGTKGLSV